jgi:hypothetical protein
MYGAMPPLPDGFVIKHEDNFDIPLTDSVMLQITCWAKGIVCVQTQLAKVFVSLGSIVMRTAGLID